MGLSSADIVALNALGWDTTINPGGWVTSDVASTAGISLGGDVPEPEAWSLMILGAALTGATCAAGDIRGAGCVRR